MRSANRVRCFMLLLIAAGLIWGLRSQVQAEPEQPMTLLGMLEEFRYPDAQLPRGATMSDGATMKGGERTCVSTRCNSILTTSDSYQKVVEFYRKKFCIPEETGEEAGRVDAPFGGGQSVFLQEDSEGRPVSLCVISINRDTTATTLVISRHKEESLTHIAWSHYVRH